MTQLDNVGFYGKIPSNGDFVSRHLPRSFIEPWDQWLQDSIAASREQLRDQWLDNYLTGPIWRFALSKGICSDIAWAGLVMPSVDRVGRYFPLTIAMPVHDTYPLLLLADREEAWFNQAENIALAALDQNNTLEDLTKDIENLGIPSGAKEAYKDQQVAGAESHLGNSDNWHVDMSPDQPFTANLSSLMELILIQRFPQLTLWWTSGSQQIEPSILICHELPPTNGFSSLFTGEWTNGDWDNRFSKYPAPAKQVTEDSTITPS